MTTLPLLLLLNYLLTVMGFAPSIPNGCIASLSAVGPHFMTSTEEVLDPNETVARRIYVTGDVNGGYYRTCVINEARRFRKLSGTMSPPDVGSKKAEIYVEGKRKSIDSFIRWCKRGDVGLSQSIKVENVVEEFPTGLYDDFYVDTGREKK